MRWLPCICALLLWAFAVPGLAQSDDRGILQSFLEDNLSDAGRQVRIEGFAGALSARATLDRLTIADDDGIWLTVEGAVFDWNRSALLRGALRVNELSADRVVLERIPASDQAQSPEAVSLTLPDLPISIQIGSFQVDALTLGEAVLGQTVGARVSGAAGIVDQAGHARLALTRTDGAEGRFSVFTSFDGMMRDLTLEIALAEGPAGLAATVLGLPGQPAVGLTLAGKGALSDYTATLALSTDGTDRVAGQFGLFDREAGGQGFSLDLGGDLRPLVEPDYHDFLGNEARLTARGARDAAGALSLDEFRLTSAQLALRGALSLDADGWPRFVDVTGEIPTRADGQPVLLALPGVETRLDGARLRLAHDQADSPLWRFDVSVDGVARDGFALARGEISGVGALTPDLNAVDGTVTLDLSGVALDDPALQAAIGPNLRGGLGFQWVQGAPVSLTDLELAGEDYALTGAAEMSGVEGAVELQIDSDIRLEARRLARFEPLLSLPIRGSAALSVGGVVQPVSGAFRLSVAGETTSLQIGLDPLDRLIQGRATLAIEAHRDAEGVQIDRLALFSDRARIGASGAVASEASDLGLVARLVDAADVVPGLSGPVSLEARAVQTGSAWRVTSQFNAPGETRANLEAGVTLVRGEAGPVAGTVTLDVGNIAAFSGVLGREMRGTWAGRVSGSGDLRSRAFTIGLDGQSRDLQVGIAAVDALLGGASTQRGALSLAQGQVSIDTLSVESAALNAALSGVLRAGSGFADLDVSVLQPGRLVRGVPGPIDVTGQVTFSPSLVSVVADLAAPGKVAADISATGPRTETGFGPVTARVDLTSQSLAPYAALIGRRITGAVSLGADIEADLSSRTFGLGLDATAQSLQTGIADADLLLRGRTTLVAAVQGDATGRIRISEARLNGAQVAARVSGDVGGGVVDLNYDGTLANLAMFVPGLSGPLRAEGRVAGTGPFEIETRLEGPADIRASVLGQIARGGQTANLLIDGRAPLALANRYIAPNLADGFVRFNVSLNGPLDVSSISGTANIDGGSSLVIPAARLGLRDVSANVLFAAGFADIDARAAATSGGRLTLSGRLRLADNFNAEMAVDLAGVGVSDPGLYSTTVDGRITANGPLTGGALIAGRLRLGPVEIRLPDGVGSGSSLAGLRHLNEPAQSLATRVRAGLTNQNGRARSGPVYPLDLTIEAPSRIFVRGRGLDAELGGVLQLGGTTADVTTGGRFELIRGRLDILGKRLLLDEASAELRGDFDPYVRALATTESDGIEIRVSVEGLASDPEVTLLSSPELPEDEVLARLLFGRRLNEITPLQALQIANAIRTLAGRGGEGVVGRLRRNFGLDDLDLGAGEGDETGITVGKYINENIYTDVTVDTSGRSVINLNLSVSPSVTVRGSANSDGEAGIGIYFERDY